MVRTDSVAGEARGTVVLSIIECFEIGMYKNMPPEMGREGATDSSKRYHFPHTGKWKDAFLFNFFFIYPPVAPTTFSLCCFRLPENQVSTVYKSVRVPEKFAATAAVVVVVLRLFTPNTPELLNC